MLHNLAFRHNLWQLKLYEGYLLQFDKMSVRKKVLLLSQILNLQIFLSLLCVPGIANIAHSHTAYKYIWRNPDPATETVINLVWTYVLLILKYSNAYRFIQMSTDDEV